MLTVDLVLFSHESSVYPKQPSKIGFPGGGSQEEWIDSDRQTDGYVNQQIKS